MYRLGGAALRRSCRLADKSDPSCLSRDAQWRILLAVPLTTERPHTASPVPLPTAPTFPVRLAFATRNVGRGFFVALVILGLVYPANRLGLLVYPIILGAPLAWSAVKSRDASFRWWSAYLLGFLAFVIVRNAADDLGPPAAFGYVIAWERFACLGTIPSAVLQGWLGTTGTLTLVVTGVYLSYFCVPQLSLVALWRWHPDRFRWFVTASLGLWAVAAVWSTLVPTAPPWLAAREGHLSGVVSILQATLHFERNGPYRYGASVARTNYVAAMPSVHMGITWLLTLAAPSRAWRGPALVYAALMLFTIVYLGDHYVVDALAGIAVGSLVWLVARRMSR
jgi:membrane-associated phospholipid phosphatase